MAFRGHNLSRTTQALFDATRLRLQFASNLGKEEQMCFRIAAFSSALLLALPAYCQTGANQADTQPAQACAGGPCANASNFAAGASLPSVPEKAKWQTEDFRPSDASISCAVVKYDSTVTRPTLHLLSRAGHLRTSASPSGSHLEACKRSSFDHETHAGGYVEVSEIQVEARQLHG